MTARHQLGWRALKTARSMGLRLGQRALDLCAMDGMRAYVMSSHHVGSRRRSVLLFDGKCKLGRGWIDFALMRVGR